MPTISGALLAGGIWFAAAARPLPSAPAPEGPSIAAVLGKDAAAGVRTEVLVLGTPHLSGLDGFRPETLTALLATLGRFRPTVICIEHLPGREIAEMDARGGTYRKVVEMFALNDLRYGELVRGLLERTREDAMAQAEPLLERGASLDAASRRSLVANLLAAYDLPTAILQWSYLPPEARTAGPGLPPEVVGFLDKALASSNEIETIALPLARAAGLQRLVSVDSQWDGARILREPEPSLEEAFGHPSIKASRESGPYAEEKRVTAAALGAGDLLPLYLFLNGADFGTRDVAAQWSPWLRMRLPSGVDRLRYGLWESRNARMAANLTEVTASTQPERVLFLVGAAHRPFVEDVLQRFVHIRVVPLRALVRIP